MLSNRQKLVLKAIIEKYIDSKEPVGSLYLTKMPYLNFSSSTIRYDMQYLEEVKGYLKKAHTSSGRIPSKKGYQYYIDNLMRETEELIHHYKWIDNIIFSDELSRDEKLKNIVNYISTITNSYVEIEDCNKLYERVRRIEIVYLDDNEVIVLIVTNKGTVRSEKFEIPNNFNKKDLYKIISIFDQAMYDKNIYFIKEVLNNEISKPRIRELVNFKDDILNFMLKCILRFSSSDYYDSGLYNLIKQEELHDPIILKKLIYNIDNNMIDYFLKNKESIIDVYVGIDKYGYELSDCSLVNAVFYSDGIEFGSISILGSISMDYQKVLHLVKYIGKRIEHMK